MKKLVLVILFIIGITSLAESQTELEFGNVTLKDTLSGGMKLNSGSLYVEDSLIIESDRIIFDMDLVTGDIYLQARTVPFLTLTNTSLTVTKAFTSPGLTSTSNATFNDNVTIDSIVSTRTSGVIALVSDDTLITITSSVMIINSDDATATNRTFTISDGSTVGQRLTIILFEDGGTDKCELIDAGTEAGLDGTMTFDADHDNLTLIWYGSVWIEISRTEH